jgi:hypothetical protein
MTARNWAGLPWSDWADTLEALHLWTQVVGKVRLVRAPWLNHSWSVTLAVSPRGLRTGLIPHDGAAFELEFDLLDSRLVLTTSHGDRRETALTTRTVADFHADVLAMLDAVGMPVEIHPVPSEIADAVPFVEDHAERPYDPDHARALWGALLDAERVMQRFRAGFRGKASPVHFFWGSFDLAVTRFSGRLAPAHSGGIPNFPDDVAQEAYSHEVTSVGFWPGTRASPEPIFYAYAYPNPPEFASATVEPEAAFWLAELGEFALPYDAVASTDDPDGQLLAFFESTHAAAADLAEWDRTALECGDPHGPEWWRRRPHDVARS